MCSLQIVSEIEKAVKELWQGKGINIGHVTKIINENVQEIVDALPKMKQFGIDFPMEYVTTAMKNMSVAIEKRDDYLLADNLYFEWREIFKVYEEVLAEM